MKIYITRFDDEQTSIVYIRIITIIISDKFIHTAYPFCVKKCQCLSVIGIFKFWGTISPTDREDYVSQCIPKMFFCIRCLPANTECWSVWGAICENVYACDRPLQLASALSNHQERPIATWTQYSAMVSIAFLYLKMIKSKYIARELHF